MRTNDGRSDSSCSRSRATTEPQRRIANRRRGRIAGADQRDRPVVLLLAARPSNASARSCPSRGPSCGQYSATCTPGTAVLIAKAGPWFCEPGLGLNVSNWLGPPSIHNRIIDLPALAQLGRLGHQQIVPAQGQCSAAGGQSSAQKSASADNALGRNADVENGMELRHRIIPRAVSAAS